MNRIKVIIVGYCMLFFSCKKNTQCPKEGYEYINSTSHYSYTPQMDSVPLGNSIQLDASLPKTFKDESSNNIITNTSQAVIGSLGIGMIYPEYKAAADSFELRAQIGSIIKDTINFKETQLKGFRTVYWNGNLSDSFKTKITIKALAKGIYSFSFRQQSSKTDDCALFKYFPSPANDQHLYYWERYLGNPSELVRSTTYCLKVY